MTGAEWWDVVDESGSPTGEVFRRGVWPTGRLHLLAATCVVRGDGLVLMTRRSTAKDFPLRWEFPGGATVSGESSRLTAVRELQEETGIGLAEGDVELVGRFRERVALFDMYIATVRGAPRVTPDPSEVDTAEWVTWDDVEAHLAAGRMADPWVARLQALGRALRAAVADAVGS